jgi:NADH-quinone oxidoreductase subunit N
MYQISSFTPVLSINYDTICFVFILPLCIFFMILLLSFFVFCFYFCSIIFTMEEVILLIAFAFIAIFAISSRDLFSAFVLLESLNITSFILLTTRSDEFRSLESAIKYLYVSILTSIIFLIGILFVYINFGSFSYSDIELVLRYAQFLPFTDFVFGYFGLYLILFAFLIKLGIFPFYSWFINVYNGLNYFGLMFIAILSKTITIIMFLMFIANLNCLPGIHFLFFTVGLGSLVIGSFYLFYTTLIREFIAFSSLASLGFVFLFLVIQTKETSLLIIFYIFVQAFNLIFLFGILMFFKTPNLLPTHFIQLRYLCDLNIVFFFFFFVVIFSFIGVPPFPGFLPKLFMLIHLYNTGCIWTLFLFVCFIVLSCFYYIRLFQFFSVNRFDMSLVSNSFLFLVRPFRHIYFLLFYFILFSIFTGFIFFFLLTFFI